ncbi:MAG: carboxymuconolactone decarboxylase family protein [Steroidobacteraceae bacterium]
MAAPLSPVEYLQQHSPESAAAFQALRKAVMASGPLDAQTCELITLGALVTCQSESSFKTHARRLVRDGVTLAALRQAVFVTFGASTTFAQVNAGLHWIDEVAAENP